MYRIFNARRAGILLHPTSLPSPYGIGDLGPSAYRFADFLVASGQTLWQVLPLVIPDVVGSPYASSSAFAGNWLLISPDALYDDGLLPRRIVPWSGEDEPVHYRNVARRKRKVIALAFEHFRAHATVHQRNRFHAFVRDQSFWLREHALFAALKDRFGDSVPWTRWPAALRRRDARALRRWRSVLKQRIMLHEFSQWLFHEQWQRLRSYANKKGIIVIGDVPLFVTRDSADTWAHPSHFMLDRLGRPTVVGGVPPDYFSTRGQVWGDPLYDWKRLRRDGYRWWLRRFSRSFDLYDVARLDHFRGYIASWGVRAGSRSARLGSWHAAPGRELFSVVRRKFPRAAFIAEDLGIITQDVIDARNALRFPGVRVMQFGFDDLASIHVFKNLSKRCVAYTGTHDNNTVRGWYDENATRREWKNVKRLLRATDRSVVHSFVRALYKSRANTVLVPLQDVLGSGSEARMNRPGTRKGNWRWRFNLSDLTEARARELKKLSRLTRRT